LNYIFYENYTTAISNIDPFDALTDEDIKTAIRNASSLRPNLFVPEVAFENLSKQQVNRLESPSLQCVQLVYEELRKVVTEIEMHELQRFQNLRKKIIEVMNDLLSRQLQPANQQVKNLIKIQDAYINTYHPDFMGGSNSIVNVFDVANFNNEQLNQLNLNKDSQDSFDAVDEDNDAKGQQRSQIGADMLISKKKPEEGKDKVLDDGRLKNFNEYEI